MSAFDEISYRKGASWIKTMDHFIGRETLKRGLSKYVAKYSYKNADLEEFVACLNEAQSEISPDSTLDL